MMEPLLSIPEAARLLGLSPWTVRLRIRDGLIRTVKLGRRILVEPAEIRRFIEEHRRDNNSVLSSTAAIK